MRLWTLLLSIVFTTFPALGQDWSVSGFGNIAYSYENSTNIGYLRSLTQKANSQSNGSFLPDSKLGFQLAYQINTQWSATTQYVFAERAGDDPFDGVELAFIAYQPTGNLDIRLGRMGYDVFWFTDTRRVDFGHLWVRPPQEVYGWIPLQNIDGIDFTYRFSLADIDWSANFQFGATQATTDLQPGFEPNRFVSNQAGVVSLTASGMFWRARASYAQLRVDSDLPEAMELARDNLVKTSQLGLGAISNEAFDLSQQLDINGAVVRYGQLGFEFNDGHWLFVSELVNVDTDGGVLPDGIGGYAMFGHRFDSLTPYFIYARFSPDSEILEKQVDWSANPFLPADIVRLQQGAIDATNQTIINQSTISFGLRWDLTSQFSLKAQADWIDIEPVGHGLWATEFGSVKPAQKVQLFTLSASFLF